VYFSTLSDDFLRLVVGALLFCAFIIRSQGGDMIVETLYLNVLSNKKNCCFYIRKDIISWA